ncbi:MAG: hybrid sensor histidine kinase/response regulator [Pseudomonadales bacterium]|nr:hybrid sensor histidine kinase/response regulator [Pseudomonadales bacterium]
MDRANLGFVLVAGLLVVALAAALLRPGRRGLRDAATGRRSMDETPREDATDATGDPRANRTADRIRDLERAVADRDLVIATLGHELRGPLRSLLSLLDRMQQDAGTRAGAGPDAMTLAAMQRTLRHALRLADDGLEFGRLASGPTRRRSAPFLLEDLLGDLIGTVRIHQRPGVELIVTLQPGMPVRWHGDAGRIRQILTNLVVNALDHTQTGQVRVEAGVASPPGRDPSSGAGPLQLCVRDTGPGIAPEEQARLFAPFEQGAASPGSAGLGLAIVDRLTRALEGTLSLESRPGQGACFTVTLPLSPDGSGPGAAFPAPALRPGRVGLCVPSRAQGAVLADYLLDWGFRVHEFEDADALVRFLDQGHALDLLLVDRRRDGAALAGRLREVGTSVLYLNDPADRAGLQDPILPGALARALEAGHGQADPEPGTAHRRHVLVVDDHPLNRQALTEALQLIGCRVTTASDGTDALAIAAAPAARFDWVLLDRNMPELDGLATATALRGRPATRRARLVLMVNDPEDADSSCRLLMDAVFVRPAGMQALATGLNRLFDAATPASTGRRSTGAELAELRDDTLLEDLDVLTQAYAKGQGPAIEDQLHRMTGALRMCPEPALDAALDALSRALRAANPEAVQLSLERFRSLLETAARR